MLFLTDARGTRVAVTTIGVLLVVVLAFAPACHRDPAHLGTRSDPMPFGEAAHVGNWTVKVVSTNLSETGDTAQIGQPTRPSEAGLRFVLIRIEVTRSSEEPGPFWVDTRCGFSARDGNTFEAATEFGAAGSIEETGAVPKGGSVIGSLVFIIPTDEVENGALILSDGSQLAERRTYFALR